MPAIRGEAFWEAVESRLQITVPIHLKHVCESQGIDRRLNFVKVTEPEFIAYEEFVRQEDYAASIHNEANTAVYYNNKLREDFSWTPDDLTTFRKIKKFLTESDPELWIKTIPVHTPAPTSNWKLSSFLTMLIRSDNQNRILPPNKHRFTFALEYVCTYIRLIGGALLYGFLAANLPIPSLTAIGDFIGLTSAPITEGLLRIGDLKEFISTRRYPSRVWISEDATSISNRVEYDPKSNQVVGHILPRNQNGMLKCLSFEAKSAKAIGEIFENNKKSSLLNVYMAQPNDKHASPFCLMAYGTDGSSNFEEVLKRWSTISQSVEQNGIEVLGISSDGDLKLMKAMRIKMELPTAEVDIHHKYYIKGFKAKILPKLVCVQDTPHTGNKLRVKLCDTTDVHAMGNFSAVAGDLHLLVERETKDYHHLQELDLTGKDKMSFGATMRVCHPRIWKLLKEHVPGSDGTQIYLKVIFFSMQAMLSTNLNSLERIYCLWYSIYFLRIWHVWLIENGYKVSESFITKNAYECLELNGHGLLNLVFKSMEEGSLELFPWLYSSQACEGFFRNLRSLCSTFSTVVNVSVLGALRRIKQIQLLSEILAFGFDKLEHKIIFPRTRFLNASNEKQEETFEEIPRFPLPLTIESIKQVMSQARADARETAEALGMKGAENAEYEVHLKSIDSPDFTDIVDDEPDIQMHGDADDDEDDDRPCDAELKILQNRRKPINLPDFSDNNKEVTPEGPTVVVIDSLGNRKVVKKSSLCWFLDNRHKLSSDRLLRVKQGENKTTSFSHSEEVTGSQKLDEIHTNDFCIFQTEHTSGMTGNCVIGLVSGFGYMIKGTKSQRAYPQNYAKIRPEKKTKEGEKKVLGVLARWFAVNPLDKSLSINTKFTQGLIPISQYRLTIPYPESVNGRFCLDDNVYNEISELLDQPV